MVPCSFPQQFRYRFVFETSCRCKTLISILYIRLIDQDKIQNPPRLGFWQRERDSHRPRPHPLHLFPGPQLDRLLHQLWPQRPPAPRLCCIIRRAPRRQARAALCKQLGRLRRHQHLFQSFRLQCNHVLHSFCSAESL